MIDLTRRTLVLALLVPAVLALPAAVRAASPQGEDVRPPFDVFNTEYESFSGGALAGPGEENPQPAPELRVTAARAELNVPTPVGSRTTLVHGLHYGYLHLDATGLAAGSSPHPPEDLHAAGYSLTVLRKFSSSWLLHLDGGPEVASDFHNVDHDQLKVRGGGFLDYRVRRNLVWGLGAAYTDVTGRPRILPVFHLLVNPGRRARAEILFPYRGRATVTPFHGVDVGAAARLEGDRYRIGRSGGGRNTLVRYRTATLGPMLELETMNGMYLRLDAGKAFERRLEIRDPEDEAVLARFDPKSVFFVRGAISFKI